MSCLYCGRQTVWRRDSDFCSAAHRKLYHERLRQGLGRLSVAEPAPVRAAGFITALPPEDVRHRPAAGAGDLRRTPLPTRLPSSAVKPQPLAARCFAPALPAPAAPPDAAPARAGNSLAHPRDTRPRLPDQCQLRASVSSVQIAPAARLHVPVAAAAPARVTDPAGHASARRPATHLRLPLFIVSSGMAQVEPFSAAWPVSVAAAEHPPRPAARRGASWIPSEPSAVLAPPLDLACLDDADSLGAAGLASPVSVRPHAVPAPEAAPASPPGNVVPFSARTGVRRPALPQAREIPALETAGPVHQDGAASAGPAKRVVFTLRPWAAVPAAAGLPSFAPVPAAPRVNAANEFVQLRPQETCGAPEIRVAGPEAYAARGVNIRTAQIELPQAVGMAAGESRFPALPCAAGSPGSPSHFGALAPAHTSGARIPPLVLAVRESRDSETRRMPLTGGFSLRGAGSSEPGTARPAPPAMAPRHRRTPPGIPPVPRDLSRVAMAPRTDRLLRLECPARSITTVPARTTEPLRPAPRIAVRKPAFALDAFLEAIDPGTPQAPRLAAVRVIAPKRASERPAAAQVRWWYGQAKAVAAALLVATALWLGVGRAGNTVFGSNSLGKAIADRAEIQFSDDFRGGLRSWSGNLNGWSYQPDGYMRPGDFAIFAPSRKHPDYRLDFMTLVERKSVDWSVRARDSRNYYAMKLAMVKPGPRPEMKLVRYPVVDGRKGAAVEVPVTAQLNRETPYVVSVEVNGGTFTASIEGQQVDTWSDHVLASGGVAVFSEAGERARVYWLKVTSNDDLIGKLCAFLAGKRDGEVAARGPRSSWPGPWFALSLTPGASLAASRIPAGSGNGG